jgi:uncharacterized protein (TIGR02145 family)
MKRILILISVCLVYVGGYSQFLSNAEYFIDDDPGYGNGTMIPLSKDGNSTLAFDVNMDGLSSGLHTLFMRVKDNIGSWSTTTHLPFLVGKYGLDPLPAIVQAEYFFDSDPGVGAGYQMPVDPNSTTEIEYVIPLENLSQGWHTLYFRALDAHGNWGITHYRPFVKLYVPDDQVNVTYLEYFIDEDPGAGNATPVNIPAGSSVDKSFIVDPGSLPAGIYWLFVRACDDRGNWSIVFNQEFEVEPPPECPPPSVLTATNITTTTATLGWIAGEDEQEWHILWGAAGFDPETSGNLISDVFSYNYVLENLSPDSDYDFYVRTVCGTGHWSIWAGPESFITLEEPIITIPTLTTTELDQITQITAVSGGNVTDDGGATVTARGVVWSTFENPSFDLNQGITNDGAGLGEFVSNLTGLNPASEYFVRAYAANSAGTAYGEQLEFTTLNTGAFVCGTSTLSDVDGNVYNTVSIGDQCWMKENLKTTKYSNGTDIEYPGNDNNNWNLNSTGAYAWYDNEISWKDLYGALYNGYAVHNENGLCPSGWHVPGFLEFTQMRDYLVEQGYPDLDGNANGAGNALKSCRQVDSPYGDDCNTLEHPRWDSPGIYLGFGFDAYGFSALPGGRRGTNGTYSTSGTFGWWWTSHMTSFPWFYNMSNTSSKVGNLDWVSGLNGYSVRCIKDENSQVNLPSISTSEITQITINSATSGGNVSNDGGAPVTARGIVWGTSENPSIETNEGITYDGIGIGSWVSALVELTPATEYFVRAYAINSAGTAYGEEQSFITLEETMGDTINILRGGPPETNPLAIPIQITGISATPYNYDLNQWTGSWEAPQAIYDQGVYMNDADFWSNIQSNSGAGSTWYNSSPGIGYGILVVDLQQVRQITRMSVFQMFSDGKITHIALAGHPQSGSAAPEAFDEGWAEFLPKSSIGAGTNHTIYVSNPTKFFVNAETRYVKIMAYNDGSLGSTSFIELKGIKMYGGEAQVLLPQVSTANVNGITISSAVSGGNVSNDGGAPVTARGIVWSTSQNPSVTTYEGITYDGEGTGSWVSELAGLNPATEYFVRAYATNSAGTAYGEQLSFITLSGEPPNWEPNPYLQYNMQIIGQLEYEDGAISLNGNDRIGAFEGEECRGVMSPDPGFMGILFLTVGSNQQSGETIIFKAWLNEENRIVELNQSLLFENQLQTGSISNPFIFSYGQAELQTIVVPAGWSGISSFVIPDTPAVETIFAPVVDDMVILQNLDGMYWPYAGVNTIGNWNDMSGYQVKMEFAQQVTFTGAMQDNLTANLEDGWNYLPVLNPCDNFSEDLFSEISGNLQIVKEVAGPDVYWPQFGINTLEQIKPGKAYFVLVDEDVEVEFPECANKSLTLTGASTLSGQGGNKNLTESSDLSEFGISTTPITHTIAIPPEAISGLPEGGIIGVYGTYGQCYGAVLYQNHNLALTAFGDDPTSTQIDGLTEGEIMQFRVFNPETGKETMLEVAFDEQMPQGGYFMNHGLSAIKSIQATGIGGASEIENSVNIYPNPSTGIFNVSAPTLSGLDWKAHDIHGSIIATGNENSNEFSINLTSYPKGIYYLKITHGGMQIVRKIVLQ